MRALLKPSYLPIPVSTNNFQWTCMIVIDSKHHLVFPFMNSFKSPMWFFPSVIWDMLRMNDSLFLPIFFFLFPLYLFCQNSASFDVVRKCITASQKSVFTHNFKPENM